MAVLRTVAAQAKILYFSMIQRKKFSNSQILDKIKLDKQKEFMEKKRWIELAVKIVVAALTAFLTALGTTSCMRLL